VSTAPGSVEVCDLRVQRGGASRPVVALDGLDLSVPAGSFVAIVGPSGCGKSTLLRVLAGLLVPDGGSAHVAGRSVAGRPGSCAWMPQRDALLPWRSVLDNAVLAALVGGEDPKQARRRALELLDRFGLGEVAPRWPAELSGGMRQRVAVLRTFLDPAPVLLLDEPFGALDALTRQELQGWLASVWEDAADGAPRRTVLLVTHDVEEALLLADRVVVLSAAPGRVVADHRVAHQRPRSPDLVGEPAFVADRAELLAALGVPRHPPVSGDGGRAPH